MKIIRTNLPPGLLILLILLAILFAFIVIPILIVLALWYLLVSLFTGGAVPPFGSFRGRRAQRDGNVHEGPFRQAPRQERRPSAADDDTIECEVISARTIGEDGQEDR